MSRRTLESQPVRSVRDDDKREDGTIAWREWRPSSIRAGNVLLLAKTNPLPKPNRKRTHAEYCIGYTIGMRYVLSVDDLLLFTDNLGVRRVGALRPRRQIVTERERHDGGGKLLRDRPDFGEWATHVVGVVEERRAAAAVTSERAARTDQNGRWRRTKIRLLNLFSLEY
jgi:hypothetical protein